MDRTIKDLASSAPKLELPSAEEVKRGLTSATPDFGNVESDVKSAASNAASSAKEVIRDVRGPSFLPSTGDVQSAADDVQGVFKDVVPNVNVSLPSLNSLFPDIEGNKALNNPAGKVKNDVSSAQSAIQDVAPSGFSLPNIFSSGSEADKVCSFFRSAIDFVFIVDD